MWGEGGDEAIEAFRTGKHTLPSLCCHLLLPVNIIVINYLLSACQPSCIKGSVRQNYRKTYFLLLFYSSSDLEISISEISVSLEVNGILLVVYRELKTLARTNVNSYNRASFSPRNYFYY